MTLSKLNVSLHQDTTEERYTHMHKMHTMHCGNCCGVTKSAGI